MRIGVIGCGNISGIYFENLAKWPETEVVACADLDLSKAEAAAARYGVPKACSPEEVLNDQSIGLVLNLTVPKAHFDVCMAAIQAGKHVYVEKPLALSFADGKELIAAAASNGVTVGCAPDTVLGAGIQTSRKFIDDGELGSIVGGNCFMLCPGHESWHPSPEFYYEQGGGPLFDMGPYYLSALITLLGPIKSVTGAAMMASPTRTITSQPKHGKIVPVETPTHIVSILEFVSGAIVQFTASFDVQRSTLPHIELYGSKCSLLVPDPNGFGGEVIQLQRGGEPGVKVPLATPNDANLRGLGVLDQVRAAESGGRFRASGAIGLHVLEAMEKVLLSAETGTRLELETRPERPEAFS
jgi:predicted dehydrogenase